MLIQIIHICIIKGISRSRCGIYVKSKVLEIFLLYLFYFILRLQMARIMFKVQLRIKFD